MLATKILTRFLNSLGKKSIWKVKHHFKVPEGVQKLILTFPPSLSDHLLVTARYLDVHKGQWDVLINQSFPLFVEMVNSTINGGWELSVFLTDLRCLCFSSVSLIFLKVLLHVLSASFSKVLLSMWLNLLGPQIFFPILYWISNAPDFLCMYFRVFWKLYHIYDGKENFLPRKKIMLADW